MQEIDKLIKEEYDKIAIVLAISGRYNYTDKEYDYLVGKLEDMDDSTKREIAELIADEIHSPTLEGDILRSMPWHDNNYCVQADWQKPRKERIREPERKPIKIRPIFK